MLGKFFLNHRMYKGLIQVRQFYKDEAREISEMESLFFFIEVRLDY